MAEWALQVFEEMVPQGFQPNVISYTVVIIPCRKTSVVQRPYRY